MKKDFYDSIEDYLLGRLSPNAKSDFEVALKNDRQLSEEVKLQRLILEATAEKEILELRKQMKKSFEENKPGKFSPGKIWILGGLLLVALLVWFLFPSNTATTENEVPPQIEESEDTPAFTPPAFEEPEKEPIARESETEPVKRDNLEAPKQEANYLAMAQSYYQSDKFAPVISRGDSQGATDPLAPAKEAYQSGDFESALKLLQDPPQGMESTFEKLRAHSLFQMGNYTQAAAAFEGLRNGFYRNDAEWYLFLCRLAQLPEKQEAFDSIKSAIMDNPDHPFREKATQVLSQL
ncbi:MAG: hypothetical protein GYB31_18860 [Bacteroidetes bacterium]|nr:hypothetical protein [Bacteroidota bacterium]